MATPRATLIAVAPNGARRTRADHPALPLAAEEIARDAAAALERGAAMLHLHIRDAEGRHLLDADGYRAAIAAVRRAVGDRLVVQITTEAAGRYGPEEQMAVVRAVRPEAASAALRELAPAAADEGRLAEFLAFTARERIALQVILYDEADAGRLAAMKAAGKLPDRGVSPLCVLGRYAGGGQARPEELLPFLRICGALFPEWMLCAFGRDEARCVCAAALLGGDVRVGFENNLHRPDGTLAPSNAALIDAVTEPLARLGHAFLSAADFRARQADGGRG